MPFRDCLTRHLRVSVLTRYVLIMTVVGVAFAQVQPTPEASANEAEFQESLNTINAYRAWLGIPPLERHPALEQAASSHATYYELNYGDPSLAGMGLHQEDPSKPGFTGASISDRADAAGYPGQSVNENIGLSGSMITTVDWSVASINHRLPLLDPRYDHIGFGAVNNGDARIEVIMVGADRWSQTAEPEWMPWPVDGATGLETSFYGEAPNPFSGASYPVGYPITLKYYGGGSVAFHSAELRENGTSIPVLAQAGNGWLTRDTYMIAATEPLSPNTQYDVTVEATVDGQPVTHSWSFRTRGTRDEPVENGAGATEAGFDYPEGVAELDDSIKQTWQSVDGPVHQDSIDRSWVWGPDAFASMTEPYAESPGGERRVAYFDKARMEINNPDGDRSSGWFVTNGLLVRNMILGSIQVGDNEFVEHEPAQIPIAGDSIGSNVKAPTYAALRSHSAVIPGNRQPDRTGEAVKTWITQDGTKYHGPDAPDGVAYAHYDEVTGFNIADVFWDWISQAGHYDWLHAVGRPITDPHWIWAPVDGEEQWVLMQAFQRRIVTYTPRNDPEWQLEMGNAGRHFYTWRYGEAPPRAPSG